MTKEARVFNKDCGKKNLQNKQWEQSILFGAVAPTVPMYSYETECMPRLNVFVVFVVSA